MGIRTVVTPLRGKSRPSFFGDAWLVAITGILLVFGLTMLYSASWDVALLHDYPPAYIFQRQLLWAVLGIVAAVVLSRMDYHHWEKWALPAIGITLFSLTLVLLIGTGTGPKRTLLGDSVQPSELAKLVLILYLSVWLYAKRDVLSAFTLGPLPMSIILGVMGGLVTLQPDLSAALTIFMLGVLLYLLAVNNFKMAFLWLGAALWVGFVLVWIMPQGHQRLVDFWVTLRDPALASYHIAYAMRAVARGGLFGVGLGLGQTKVTGLPVPHTDSIFVVVVEELGFVGGMVVLLLFLLLLWRGIHIATHAPDMMGALMASGIAFWIAGEAILNMAVIVGALPFAGNALPFFSAGGSNLVTSLAGIGILINIARQGQTNPPFWRFSGATARVRGRNRRRSVSRAGGSANHEE